MVTHITVMFAASLAKAGVHTPIAYCSAASVLDSVLKQVGPLHNFWNHFAQHTLPLATRVTGAFWLLQMALFFDFLEPPEEF